MKLGISSYTYTWSVGIPGNLPEKPMKAMDLMGKAFELGVEVLQIADNLPLDKLSDQELKQLKQEAENQNIDIEVGTQGINHEHLKRYIEICQLFNSPFLRVVIDTKEHKPTED
ncbi:sugar phosphate isomerase/epimerase, partial [Candidatus Poribacteria bacterium]|nr:sugar phosphate isomerase/epimerase [Candidatus Poribacteria bacterium]